MKLKELDVSKLLDTGVDQRAMVLGARYINIAGSESKRRGFTGMEISSSMPDAHYRTMQDVVNFAASIVDKVKHGSNLVLVGASGTGKTRLAFATCLQAIYRGMDVELLSHSFIRSLNYNTFEEDYVAEVHRSNFKSCDILHVDDPIIPGHKLTGPSLELFDEVIYARENKTTILTINSSMESLVSGEIMPSNLVSRIFRKGSLIRECNWESFR